MPSVASIKSPDRRSWHRPDLTHLQLTTLDLSKFIVKYGNHVASVHEDSPVSVSEFQLHPPWSLDRLDQSSLPLDSRYNFYNFATGVNAYIIDTVGHILPINARSRAERSKASRHGTAGGPTLGCMCLQLDME